MQSKQDDILVLDHISKRFGDTPVLHNISLRVAAGEFITLLGSSGCGKTTTLRILAGLEQPDEGRVLLEDTDVTFTPPNRRDVSMVFQNYALFPHMTVAENIGYSLRLRRVAKSTIRSAVADVLALVQLSEYADRMPSELSGGQRQRVAIARSVVRKPKVLLLDEPLGALDLQLRRQMQLELKRLQKQLGITFIYITHDQEEALNMSSRIAVMHEGHFEQIGTPAQIYDRPRTSYVATFVGNANILHGVVSAAASKNAYMQVSCEGWCAAAHTLGHTFAAGDAVTLAVRSEHLDFTADKSSCGIAATVQEKTFAGGMLRIVLHTTGGTELIASRHGIDIDMQVGDEVRVSWDAANAVPVDIADNAVQAAAGAASAEVSGAAVPSGNLTQEVGALAHSQRKRGI